MKKIFWGMLLALIACVGTPAQNQPQFTGAGILIFSGVPTGTCTPNLAIDQATGGIYYCASGTWTSTGGGSAPSGPAGGALSGTYPNPGFANPPISSDIFYATTACNGLSNCVQWVDDDTTDNCGSATTAWVAAINAMTVPAGAYVEVYISGAGKGFLLNTCQLDFTVAHDVTLRGTLDFGTTQTPTSCIQDGVATPLTAYGAGSIDWRWRGGTLTGCTAATKYGMESMPWMGHGYIEDMNIRNFGPGGNTAGLCTKSSIKFDIIAEAHMSGIMWQGSSLACASANTMDCGSTTGCGTTTGQNTLHFSDSTVIMGAGTCASVGHWEGGTHSTITNVSFWGFDVPLLLGAPTSSGAGGWMVIGNTIDNSGSCSANGVAAAIQIGHNGSGITQGPIDIIGNDFPSHTGLAFARAGNSTDTIQGLEFIGNDVIGAAMFYTNSTFVCAAATNSMPCSAFGNNGFNNSPNGSTGLSINNPSQLAIYSTGNKTANITATTAYTAPAGGFSAGMTVNVTSYETTAASGSSTLPTVTIAWTDAITGAASSAALTPQNASANALGSYPCGSIWIYPKFGTTVTIATSGYASSAPGMAYNDFVAVSEQ